MIVSIPNQPWFLCLNLRSFLRAWTNHSFHHSFIFALHKTSAFHKSLAYSSVVWFTVPVTVLASCFFMSRTLCVIHLCFSLCLFFNAVFFSKYDSCCQSGKCVFFICLCFDYHIFLSGNASRLPFTHMYLCTHPHWDTEHETYMQHSYAWTHMQKPDCLCCWKVSDPRVQSHKRAKLALRFNTQEQTGRCANIQSTVMLFTVMQIYAQSQTCMCVFCSWILPHNDSCIHSNIFVL